MSIQDRYDLIVVGCGFCGSIIARLAAEECGRRVLILERRNHIAGNMYDEFDKNGFLVQKYGPHIFHTNEDWIYRFVCRFSDWYPFQVFYGVELDGRCVPAPFGFKAIRMLYPEEKANRLIERLCECYPNKSSIPVLDLMRSEDREISELAEMLYQKDYLPYAAKQWNLDPKELDRSVVERMPIILSERENYFDTKYEVLPAKGYTAFFKNMLSHEKIDIQLNTDACDFLEFDLKKGTCSKDGEVLTIPIIFTGALEDLFGSAEPLPYRSLYFDYKTLEQESYQPTAILTYPQTNKYLRTTEYSKLMQVPPKGRTVVAFEYSVPYNKNMEVGNEPYYPILTAQNIAKNDAYRNRLGKIENVYSCGRLADYKYYNMDEVIVRAFDAFRDIKGTYFCNPER